MPEHRFWYVDDHHRIRWAVRVSRVVRESGHAEIFIVFTSPERQVQTALGFEKEQNQLSRYEILELLAQAKQEAVSVGNALQAVAA